MNVSEKICPVCKTKNDPRSSHCEHCGAALDESFSDADRRTKTSDMQALTPDMIREWLLENKKEAVAPASGIAFYVDGHSMPAYIDPEGEFVVGRKVDTSSELLLDLAPFAAYSLGVSRRHVIIRRTREGYEIQDLGSVNGTWLNEERLVPHQYFPLPSGSHLRLGRMRMLVLYQPFEETNQKR
jgi:hypothetical protein